MAASALNRPGQDNAAGDAAANFKMKFTGLMAMHFNRGLKVADRIMRTPFPKGAKSIEAKFHDAETAVAHTPGNDIFVDGATSGNPQKGSREIKLGKKILKAGLLDHVDSLMEDFDSQKFHAAAIREALQRKYDQYCFRAIIAAARRNGGADEYTNEPDLHAYAPNGILTAAFGGAPTTAKADLLQVEIMKAAEAFDNLDVPDEGRTLLLRPFAYNLLFYTTNKDWLNRDYGNNLNGSTGERKIARAAGFDVVRSNNIPTTDLSAEGSNQTELDVDFTGTAGAIFHREAALRSDAMEIGFDMWEEKRFRAKAAYCGEFVAAFGGFRRECAIHLKFT